MESWRVDEFHDAVVGMSRCHGQQPPVRGEAGRDPFAHVEGLQGITGRLCVELAPPQPERGLLGAFGVDRGEVKARAQYGRVGAG